MPANQKTTIRFMKQVDNQSAEALIQCVEREFREGVKRFRILVSSPGGFVDPGLSVFNYLKGIPVEEIETVNFGSVDSIAAVIFCAGTKRISVPNARFIIHDISRNTSQPLNLSETTLVEWVEGLRIDRQNIAKVIAETCKKEIEEIQKLMRGGAVLGSVAAQDLGLVTQIDQKIVEDGAKLITV
ncbi:MAG: ATP-dependent Clp protease proteolytic subunit [Candidatus Vogelbacteria bacterium]|nr:ATP-dependent Clp protease proteolytic subunit [Candidatus Vogelbacteria bacterium]